MSSLIKKQEQSLLAVLKEVDPSVQFAPEEGFLSKESAYFSETCSCYSEMTTEPCELNVHVRASKASTGLSIKLEEAVRRWAEINLVWSGCSCCRDYLDVRIYLFGPKDKNDS